MPIVELSCVELLSCGKCDVEMTSRIQSSSPMDNGGKSFHEFYCTVPGIVTTVVSVIDSYSGALSSKKGTSIPLWKKYDYDIVVLLNSKNGMKVAKLAKDVDILTMMLTKVLNNKDKIISHLLEYLPKHNRVRGNPNQRTVLTIAKLWH